MSDLATKLFPLADCVKGARSPFDRSVRGSLVGIESSRNGIAEINESRILSDLYTTTTANDLARQMIDIE